MQTLSIWLCLAVSGRSPRQRLGDKRRDHDRSAAPRRYSHRVASALVAEIEQLRRQRMTVPTFAPALGMGRSTVDLVLRRLGLSKLTALEPKVAIQR